MRLEVLDLKPIRSKVIVIRGLFLSFLISLKAAFFSCSRYCLGSAASPLYQSYTTDKNNSTGLVCHFSRFENLLDGKI